MDEDRFDDEKIEQGVRMILEGIGEDPDRGGLRETPARVANLKPVYMSWSAKITVSLRPSWR